ncbi:MAG TPA: hypothetical protein PLB25_04170 [Rhodoferax sp.]|nr:hypothetical protein [Rhodoferax sp.]
MQLAKQASRNDAVRPNPPVQIGEVISNHILTSIARTVAPKHENFSFKITEHKSIDCALFHANRLEAGGFNLVMDIK